jgi:hypothetical protein
MALADLLVASGQGSANAGLLTYTERFARHQDLLAAEWTSTTQYLV